MLGTKLASCQMPPHEANTFLLPYLRLYICEDGSNGAGMGRAHVLDQMIFLIIHSFPNPQIYHSPIVGGLFPCPLV